MNEPASPEGALTIASPRREGPGTRIGPYKILQLIGEGGFGSVFQAEQEQPVQRMVALKIIKLGMDTRQVIARFEAERQALAMMDHPNIARVLDAGATENGRPFFVMELVKGEPIVEYCDRHNLSIRERLEQFAQVCHAVQHAHTKGIIHRDIKPSNILVSMQDGLPSPKVIDFGIAKATSARLTEKTLFTENRQMIGTPEYMSPEQAEGSLDIDTRTDVYSLGVLLYELLTGATPFDGSSLRSAAYAEMQRIIREVEPMRPSTRLSKHTVSIAAIAAKRHTEPRRLHAIIRGELDWIVLKALEKDRMRRYETANGLAMDVRRYLNGEAVSAAPPSAVYLVRKFVRRHRTGVAAAAVIVATLVTGIVGTTTGIIEARKARVDADHKTDLALEAEGVALREKAMAQRQAYSADMLGASDAVERGQVDAARDYLERAPADLRGWEWRYVSSRLDLCRRIDHTRAPLVQVHVAPDGRSYYGVSEDRTRTVQRWDMETGRLLQTIATDQPCFDSWLLAGVKRMVLRLGDPHTQAGSVEVWDLEHGTRLSTRPYSGLCQPSPDGSMVVSLSPDRVRVTDLMTGADRMSPVYPGDAVHHLGANACFHPDGKRLVVEWTLGQVRLVDSGSFEVLSTTAAHENGIWAFAISPDGRLLASPSSDATVRITDISADPPVAVATMRGHGGLVDAVCFSPDGSLVASTGQDRTVRLWETRTGIARGVFQTAGTEPRPPTFFPDGQTVVSADISGDVYFWDVRSADGWTLRGHRSFIYAVLMSPDGGTVYSGGWDGFVGQAGCIRFWDAATGEQIAATGPADSYLFSAGLSPDGSRLAAVLVAHHSVRIDVFDTMTGAKVASVPASEFEGEFYGVCSLAFDPSGRRFGWVNGRGRAVISDTQTGATLVSWQTLEDGAQGARLAWSPDGAVIATCHGQSGTVCIWDGKTLEPIRKWSLGHSGMPCTVGFSPDGRRVVTTSESGVARVWDVATGTPVHELIGHGYRVLCGSYSPDGLRIATGGNDNFVRVWDARTFEPVARLSGHLDYVYSLAWRADSQMLVSGSGDHTVRIWDTQALKDRMEARRERQGIVAQVEPMVQRLFGELGDAAMVVERLKADASLSPRAGQVALQVALRMAIERREGTAKPGSSP